MCDKNRVARIYPSVAFGDSSLIQREPSDSCGRATISRRDFRQALRKRKSLKGVDYSSITEEAFDVFNKIAEDVREIR